MFTCSQNGKFCTLHENLFKTASNQIVISKYTCKDLFRITIIPLEISSWNTNSRKQTLIGTYHFLVKVCQVKKQFMRESSQTPDKNII